jgi:N-acetylglucosamine-6-phosphate deacetylase
METRISAGKALVDGHWRNECTVHISEGVITDITAGAKERLFADLLVPGLIDNHNHGGYGCSVMTSGTDAYAKWLEHLARKGVTATLAGIYTATVEQMRAAMSITRQVMEMQQCGRVGGSKLLGVHLEGPFLCSEKPGLGAMDKASIQKPSVSAYLTLVQGYESIVREVTLAPELQGSQALIDYLSSRGIRVLAGHTTASYDEGVAAFTGGVSGVCHFFNASAGIRHRDPGLLTAALLRKEVYCEAICDFHHVHPAALELLYRM